MGRFGHSRSLQNKSGRHLNLPEQDSRSRPFRGARIRWCCRRAVERIVTSIWQSLRVTWRNPLEASQVANWSERSVPLGTSQVRAPLHSQPLAAPGLCLLGRGLTVIPDPLCALYPQDLWMSKYSQNKSKFSGRSYVWAIPGSCQASVHACTRSRLLTTPSSEDRHGHVLQKAPCALHSSSRRSDARAIPGSNIDPNSSAVATGLVAADCRVVLHGHGQASVSVAAQRDNHESIH